MKLHGLFVGVLLALFVITAYAEPEADPEPSALAEADALAEPSSPSKTIKHMIKNRSRAGRCKKCCRGKKCKKSCKKSCKKANRKKRTCLQCVPGGMLGGLPGGMLGGLPGGMGGTVGGSGNMGGSIGNSGSSGSGLATTSSSGTSATSSSGVASTSSSVTDTTASSAQLLDYCQYNCSNSTNIGCGATNTLGSSCPSGASTYVFTDSDINLMLSLANDARNAIANGSVSPFETAAQMPRMSWNAPLAQLALYNAQQCNFEHDSCHNTDVYNRAGQNLGYTESSSGYQDISDVIRSVHTNWYDEHNSATMDDINSFPSDASAFDHFTQMVRDKSPTMGCAAALYTADSGLYRTLITCNYASTNTIGAPVYVTGTSCSGCTSGCDTEYTALCTVNESVDVNSTS